MPIVTISLYKGRSLEEKRSICLDIQRCIQSALRIEHNNFHHRIHEYTKDEMIAPPVSSDKYIAIEIQFMSRRNREDKEKLYGMLRAELVKYGIADNDYIVILNDPPLENWFIRGRTGTEIAAERRTT